jgi:23S rRNA pseudouridine1911/1915/1917 synthase
MNSVEFQWLASGGSCKEALQQLLGCSGQLLKKHFSSNELQRQVYAKDVMKLSLDLVNHLKINPVYSGPDVLILKETQDYIAVHKPAGVHCHPLKYSDTDTLLNYLASQNLFSPLMVNTDQYDRGLLYRLDYETSGVVILAKNLSFHSLMRNDFEKQMKKKLYLAIVEGDFDREGNWTHFFKATGAKGSKQKVFDLPQTDSHEGSLMVKKISARNEQSLLLIELKTGLRHQIRAQLSHLGHPLLGDELYGGKKAERLFLHAWMYEWNQTVEDSQADLFDRFFDLDSALKVSHDMLGIFKSR